MHPHTIDTRWVKIHSVRKILVFSIDGDVVVVIP